MNYADGIDTVYSRWQDFSTSLVLPGTSQHLQDLITTWNIDGAASADPMDAPKGNWGQGYPGDITAITQWCDQVLGPPPPATAGVNPGVLAACITLGIGLLMAAAGLLTRTVARPRHAKPAPLTARPPDTPICVHDNAVPVDNDMLGRLAWLCPDCGSQLAEDWNKTPPARPAPAAVPAPAARWTWHYWCTCGRDRTGTTATETAAKAACLRCVRAHQRAGHRWQYEWKNIG
jgi:hypothetical protein